MALAHSYPSPSPSVNSVVTSHKYAKHDNKARIIILLKNWLSILPEVRVLLEAPLKVLVPGMQSAEGDVGHAGRGAHLLLGHGE